MSLSYVKHRTALEHRIALERHIKTMIAYDGEQTAALVQYYNSLMDDNATEEANRLLALCPNLLNYDEAGNYVGPVANENGWTP